MKRYKVLSLPFLILNSVIVLNLSSCLDQSRKEAFQPPPGIYTDVPFIQETHIGFRVSNNPADNEVRSMNWKRLTNV